MELSFALPTVTTAQAVDGMRRPFMQAFGRSWVGQRLARAAWPAFYAAMMHGSGLDVATAHARLSAEDRNRRTMLVARWTSGRIARVVERAVSAAADAR